MSDTKFCRKCGQLSQWANYGAGLCNNCYERRLTTRIERWYIGWLRGKLEVAVQALIGMGLLVGLVGGASYLAADLLRIDGPKRFAEWLLMPLLVGVDLARLLPSVLPWVLLIGTLWVVAIPIARLAFGIWMLWFYTSTRIVLSALTTQFLDVLLWSVIGRSNQLFDAARLAGGWVPSSWIHFGIHCRRPTIADQWLDRISSVAGLRFLARLLRLHERDRRVSFLGLDRASVERTIWVLYMSDADRIERMKEYQISEEDRGMAFRSLPDTVNLYRVSPLRRQRWTQASRPRLLLLHLVAMPWVLSDAIREMRYLNFLPTAKVLGSAGLVAYIIIR